MVNSCPVLMRATTARTLVLCLLAKVLNKLHRWRNSSLFSLKLTRLIHQKCPEGLAGVA